MSEVQNTVFVGIDWAHSQHQIVVCERGGKLLHRERIEARCRRAQADLIERLRTIAERHGQLCIGIESRGLSLVDDLLDQGWDLWLVPPSKVDQMRKLASTSGAKDDLRDATAIAAVLASGVERGWLRRIEARDPDLAMLRTLSRERTRLVRQRTAALNRLRAALSRYWPAFLAHGLCLSSLWVLELWQHLRSPARTRRCKPAPLQRMLDARPYLKRDAATLLAALGNNADASSQEAACAQFEAEMAVEDLRGLATRIKRVEGRIGVQLEQVAANQLARHPERTHSDVEILLSMPGMGAMLLAVVLGEAGSLLEARDLESLRRMGGVAPVTSQSGRPNQRLVSMRYQRNQQLHNALQHFGGLAANNNELDAERRRQMRQRGHSSGRIRRQLADGLLKVAVALLRADELYDDTRRVGARRALNESPSNSNP